MPDECPDYSAFPTAMPVPPNSYPKRLAVVAAFVALWVALGMSLRLDPNAYLLLGVPLTIAFQRLVARRPLASLWVRDAPRLRVTPGWLVTTAAFAAMPVYSLYQTGLRYEWIGVFWYACAIAGAPAAAYAVANADRRMARSAIPAAGVTALFSVLMIAGGVARHGVSVLTPSAILTAGEWTLRYFPVCFFLEEVTFRGALDAYVYRPGDKRGVWTAFVVSFLWGVWHIGAVPISDNLFAIALVLGVTHTVVGVPLTMSWRIGGSLLMPALAHATIDGVRNAMPLGP
ncbi:MAG: CPBP family intramembrane glutamic endopeptidase [Gemmataceae bacterium]